MDEVPARRPEAPATIGASSPAPAAPTAVPSAALGAAPLLTHPELVQALWARAVDALALSDGDGIVLAANPAYFQLYGYGADAVVGQSFAVIFPPEQRAWAVAQYQQVFADPAGDLRYESVIQRADGTERVVEARVSFLSADGQRVAMLSTIRDITERVRAEAAVRASEARLQTALSIETVGVLFFRLDGTITDANTAFVRLSGYRREDLLRTVHWAVLTPPEFRDITARAAADLAAQGETVPYEKQLLRKDGTHWWALCAPKRLSGSGSDAECVEFILDITARKHAEAVVARAFAAEQAARANAEAALATRDQFLAIATHELRSPLTGLVGYAELLQRKSQAGRLDDDAGRRIADIMVRQAHQLNRLVEQLFDVSRIARGYLELECRPLDLGALVAQVTEEFRLGLTDETQRRIAVTRPPEPLLVDGDAARLEQVIRNLLSNAVKYSPDGGPIGISVARQGTDAVLSVTDTGIGIPAEAHAQLFQSFYRARNVGTIGGFGIGLHVVQAIVERHGGQITVASVEGQGSTVRTTLPLTAAPA